MTDKSVVIAKRTNKCKLQIALICVSIFFFVFTLSVGNTFAEQPQQSKYQILEETHTETELPETQDKGTFELSFSPKFEDGIKRDVIRYHIRGLYGITDNLDVRAEIVFYNGNFARDEWDSGLSNALLGTRYKFKEWPNFMNIRSAVGFNFLFPLGNPPRKVVDRYSRLQPYITFSRFLDRNPRVLLYSNLRFTFIADTPFREKPSKSRPNDSLRLTIGGMYNTTNLKYVLETAYYTTEIGGGGKNTVFLSPGIVWNVPQEHTSFLPGRFQLSTGVEVPLTNEDDNYRVFAKIKWDYNPFKKSDSSEDTEK